MSKIKTKSVQDKKSKSDGIRICIMRRIKPEFEFDIWIPNLAPSTKLLQEYHDEKIDWGKFSEKYKKEVFKKQNVYINLISDLAAKQIITILCWEKKGENCHRIILADRLKEVNKNITLKHV